MKHKVIEFILKHKFETGLLFIPVLILIGLRVLGFDGLYGQDSYEYLRYSVEIKKFFLTGIHPGHSYWTAGFPILAALFSFLVPATVSVQLVSFLSLFGVLYFTWRLIMLLYKEHSNAILFLCTALLLSPYMLRGSLVSMSDIPSAFWLLGSAFFAVKYYRFHGFREMFLSVLFGSLSVFTRYAAIVPVAIIFMGLTYLWLKNIRWLHLFCLLLPIAFFALHLFFNQASVNPAQHFPVNNWSFLNYFKRSFDGESGSYSYLFPTIVHVIKVFFHPGFFILNSVFLFLIIWMKKIKLDFGIVIIGLALLGNTLFLAGLPFQNPRFLLLTYPFTLILIYPGFEYIMNFSGKYKLYLFGFLIVLQIALFTRAIMPAFQLSLLEKKLVSQMRQYQNQTLYIFDVDVALQGRGLKFNYRNLWSEKYSSFESGSLVLFNPEKIKPQWEGKTPMLNWDYLNENYQLQLLDEFGSDWKLYRIEE